MCENSQHWWTHTDPESLAEDYDCMFGALEIYRSTLKSYFNGAAREVCEGVCFIAAEGKKERYIAAGGKYY